MTNDECSLAEPIACSQVITATTVCADTTESQYCDQFFEGQYFHGGLWYSIVGTGDTLRATLCFENTDYDTYLSVYEGSCDNLNCVAGNDDQGDADAQIPLCSVSYFASAVDWESEAGVEYLLHVSGSNAVTPAVGGFDFVLICDGVSVGGCLDPLACNYNGFVTFDDGSCDYSTCAGCGLASACNFDSTAFINDLTLCDFGCYGCTDDLACNYSPDATIESGLCEYSSCRLPRPGSAYLTSQPCWTPTIVSSPPAWDARTRQPPTSTRRPRWRMGVVLIATWSFLNCQSPTKVASVPMMASQNSWWIRR